MHPTVAVIGSGVAGASTAFALARAGSRVTVVDSDYAGQATAAGAGIIQPWSSGLDGALYDLYAAGAAYYPKLVRMLANLGISDIGYQASGSLVVHSDPARLDEVAKRVVLRTSEAPVAGSVQRVDAASARSLFPPLAHDLHGLHITGGARVDGRKLRAGLLLAAQRLGATVEHAEAHLEINGCSGYAVRIGQRRIEADAVVVATGAWTNRLLKPLGYQIQVEPQRGQIIHLLVQQRDTGNWPSVLPLSSHYMVSFERGRIVVGATRETGSGFDPRITAEGVREVLDNALAIAPGLASATVLETRVGLRPLASKQAPFLGSVQALPNLYLNAGFGAAGLTMAPVAGAALAQVILEGSSEVDLSPFAPPEHVAAP